jgi:uncharacterized membrane protein YhhN
MEDPKMLRGLVVRQILIASAVAVGLLAPALGHGSREFRLCLQGVPTVLLMILAATHPNTESRRYRWGIVVALGFSLVGGVYLDIGQFVKGVFGFLAANIAYLTAFTVDVRFGKRLTPFAILGLGGATILVLGWQKIPAAHVVPVCLYAVAIISVPAQAIARSLIVRRAGTVVGAVGATLLLISDSAIGIHIFYSDFPGADLFIMSTYFVGQWLTGSSVGYGQAKMAT